MNVRDQRDNRLSQDLVHLVTARASFVYSPMECLVYQCVPNTCISEQFESILLTIFQRIPIFLL